MYVDTSVMMGMTGDHNGTGFDNIEYMVCRPENDFFPDLTTVSGSALRACKLRARCTRSCSFQLYFGPTSAR